MTSELRRRLLVTLGGLAAVWLLRAVPLRGVDIAALGQMGDALRSSWGRGSVGRVSLGALGIWPYLLGSVLATLLSFLLGPTRSERGVEGQAAWSRDEPRLAVIIAIVVAALQGLALSIFLENLGMVRGFVVAQPGALFRLTTCVTLVGATMLVIGVARLISVHGLGNGVVLIWGLGLAESLVHSLVYSAINHPARGPEVWMAILVLAAGWLALATCWLSLRWTLDESRPPDPAGTDEGARPMSSPGLHVSGVGIAGVRSAMTLVLLPAVVAGFLPPESGFAQWSARFAPNSVPYAAALFLLGALATYVFTAWAYDPAGVRSALARLPGAAQHWGPLLEEDRYDRRLTRMSMLSVVGAPLACALFTLLARGLGAPWLQAVSLVVLAAIALDTTRQWRVHRAMALGPSTRERADACPGCGYPLSPALPFCEACGVALEDEASSEAPAEDPVVAYCIVCRQALRAERLHLVGGRAVCDTHADLTFVEGWALLARPTTMLEAELLAAGLAEARVEAVVLANTLAPAYGTLGIFEVQSAVPLLAHSRCGFGDVKVLVRPADWTAALSFLAQPAEPVPVANPDNR